LFCAQFVVSFVPVLCSCFVEKSWIFCVRFLLDAIAVRPSSEMKF
jgi:hypothetical protein